jgi:hypothetical protein
MTIRMRRMTPPEMYMSVCSFFLSVQVPYPLTSAANRNRSRTGHRVGVDRQAV